jgi:hypothetical protein
MDFIHFDPEYRVLACTRCQYAIPLDCLAGHLQDRHHRHLNPQERLEYASRFNTLLIQDPTDVVRIQPPLHTPPIPYLTLYNDGICCQLCAGERPYICRNKQVMTRHLKKAHGWRRRRRRPRRLDPQLTDVTWSPIACQTFHHCIYKRYFPVDTGTQLPNANTIAAAAAVAASSSKSRRLARKALQENL